MIKMSAINSLPTSRSCMRRINDIANASQTLKPVTRRCVRSVGAKVDLSIQKIFLNIINAPPAKAQVEPHGLNLCLRGEPGHEKLVGIRVDGKSYVYYGAKFMLEVK